MGVSRRAQPLQCVSFCHRVDLAQQHASGEEVGSSGVRRNVEHLSKCFARSVVILCLDIADAKNVRSVDVGPRKPSLDFFQQGDRLLWPGRPGISKVQQLRCFVVSGIFADSFFERLNRVYVITFLVVCRTNLVVKSGGRWRLRSKLSQIFNGVVVFPLL